MKWIDVNKRLPVDGEFALFWVKWEGGIWHAKTGWVKDQSSGKLIVIPRDYTSAERFVKYWTRITPPKGL